MDVKEAIESRHVVRRYLKKPLDAPVINAITDRLAQINRESGLSLTLVTNNSDGISLVGRLMGKHANNYIVLAGPDIQDLGERIGYYGADAMLYAQTLGLNSWWIGGLFNEKAAASHVFNGAKVLGVLVIGYGATQGEPHRSKTIQEVATYEGGFNMPQWFRNGVQSLLKAPSALGKQPYTVVGNGNEVNLTCGTSHLADIDCGIGKYFFEVGAGKNNFSWV